MKLPEDCSRTLPKDLMHMMTKVRDTEVDSETNCHCHSEPGLGRSCIMQ